MEVADAIESIVRGAHLFQLKLDLKISTSLVLGLRESGIKVPLEGMLNEWGLTTCDVEEAMLMLKDSEELQSSGASKDGEEAGGETPRVWATSFLS